MAREVSNSDDIIDSRDIIERIEELEAMVEDDSIDDDEKEELEVLQALAAEGQDYASDWKYGETLIRDSHFQDYAEEFFNDTADSSTIDAMNQWPLRHIDWEAAAEELKQDYTTIDFDGVDYWIRST